MSMTTLVRNNRVADRYMDMLGKGGALVPGKPENVVGRFDELGIPHGSNWRQDGLCGELKVC